MAYQMAEASIGDLFKNGCHPERNAAESRDLQFGSCCKMRAWHALFRPDAPQPPQAAQGESPALQRGGGDYRRHGRAAR